MTKTKHPYKAKKGEEYYCKLCNMQPKKNTLMTCKKGYWCVCKCKRCLKGTSWVSFGRRG